MDFLGQNMSEMVHFRKVGDIFFLSMYAFLRPNLMIKKFLSLIFPKQTISDLFWPKKLIPVVQKFNKCKGKTGNAPFGRSVQKKCQNQYKIDFPISPLHLSIFLLRESAFWAKIGQKWSTLEKSRTKNVLSSNLAVEKHKDMFFWLPTFCNIFDAELEVL